jgi:hypothetical protein
VNPVITGIVIDQTRETGKWYVREVKNETGDGVKPVFLDERKVILSEESTTKCSGQKVHNGMLRLTLTN